MQHNLILFSSAQKRVVVFTGSFKSYNMSQYSGRVLCHRARFRFESGLHHTSNYFLSFPPLHSCFTWLHCKQKFVENRKGTGSFTDISLTVKHNLMQFIIQNIGKTPVKNHNL